VAERVRIGVSSCLLGQKVRYDGQHKHDHLVTDLLAQHVELVPVCPEVEVGMGVPREPIHLVAAPGRRGGVSLLGSRSATDHTDAMLTWSAKRVRQLEALDLRGYVFKKDSPSCGVFRVRLRRDGQVTRDGVGMFARVFHAALPLVPVEEEGRLRDARLRESFFERVFAYERLKALGRELSRGALVAFHARHQMLLLAHGQTAYRALGRLVADAKSHRPRALYARYAAEFMKALERRATPKSHRNVLEHMLGHLADHLDAADRRELRDVIAEHAAGRLPLVVPVTLLRHHVRRHAVRTLEDQVYLDPHPHELMLRNHV
jgi:uncharacterized protein YbgA (DUF1722 family)/uncharacterized protein YbbK (DUF523 family)